MVKINYSLEDVRQTAIGAVVATLFFFSLRGGDPGPFISHNVGIGIFSVWMFLLYKPFKEKKGKDTVDFLANVGITAGICTLLAIWFGLATWEQMNGIIWFGSPAMIATMMGTPIALLFDLKNLTSPLSRYYINRRN